MKFAYMFSALAVAATLTACANHPGGGIALLALQGIISAGASAANQGKLQGVLVSLTNLTGVAGPLLFAFIFSQTQQSADGTVWLIGTALYGLLLAICLLIRKPAPVAATC